MDNEQTNLVEHDEQTNVTTRYDSSGVIQSIGVEGALTVSDLGRGFMVVILLVGIIMLLSIDNNSDNNVLKATQVMLSIAGGYFVFRNASMLYNKKAGIDQQDASVKYNTCAWGVGGAILGGIAGGLVAFV